MTRRSRSAPCPLTRPSAHRRRRRRAARVVLAAGSAILLAAGAGLAPGAHAQGEPAAGGSARVDADAPVRVEGAWRGIAYEGGARFAATWQITQNAGIIRGAVTENRIGGSGYGRYAISGQVRGETLTYQADNWASRRPPGWCLPAGSLVYSRDDEKEYLSGRLRMNSTAGGCSAHMPTAKRNLTSRGDTGRVLADCSNNRSAGACPRVGFGTLRLERELD